MGCVRRYDEKNRLEAYFVYRVRNGARYRVTIRTNQYKPGSSTLPRYVRRKLEKGFKITHIGMLVWIPLPRAGLVPRTRGLFLLLEAVFAIIFHAVIEMSTDGYVVSILLWPRQSVK